MLMAHAVVNETGVFFCFFANCANRYDVREWLPHGYWHKLTQLRQSMKRCVGMRPVLRLVANCDARQMEKLSVASSRNCWHSWMPVQTLLSWRLRIDPTPSIQHCSDLADLIIKSILAFLTQLAVLRFFVFIRRTWNWWMMSTSNRRVSFQKYNFKVSDMNLL